jgi:hypothetical protein
MKLATGSAIFGNKSRILQIIDVGKVGWQMESHWYSGVGWEKDMDSYWERVIEYNKNRQVLAHSTYGTIEGWSD